MKSRSGRFLFLLSVFLLTAGLFGCTPEPPEPLAGTAANDILTFTPNPENKPVIRIGTQYYLPDNTLLDALQAAFPDYLFVMDFSACAGSGSEYAITRALDKGAPYDLILSGGLQSISGQRKDYFVDLSAESFLDAYLISSLHGISLDGFIYSIPGTSALYGIAYNVDMFAEHGWEVPGDTEAFFALCETIRAEGIRPFSSCFKYSIQLNRVLGMMCYDELYASPEDAVWLSGLRVGRSTYRGHMEPFYELAKRFADAGIITVDDFTASLTKQRQAFWDGECAMIDYDSVIYTYAEAENASFTIGMMPYPTKDSADAGFTVAPEYYVAIPKRVEEDPARLQLMKDVLAFLTTEEGQRAMLGESLRVSNVKGIDLLEGNPAFAYAREAYEKGNLYPAVDLIFPEVSVQDLQKESILTIFEGASVDEAITQMDASIQKSFAEGAVQPVYETLATAESNFTMLETSYYIADKFKEATGAEIGLMINGGYFRSNLASIDQGEVTSDLRRYVMKGVTAEDALTTYSLSGAQLRALLEHPIVNGEEIDALVAASGLKLTYAPWNPRGSRVVDVALADGSPLQEDTLYTVAAFSGVIAEPYMTQTLHAYTELGAITDILETAFRQDGTISPDIAGRLTLVWPSA